MPDNWLEIVTGPITIAEWKLWRSTFPELALVAHGHFFNIYATPVRGPLTPLQQTSLYTARSWSLRIDSTKWEPDKGE